MLMEENVMDSSVDEASTAVVLIRCFSKVSWGDKTESG